MRCNLLRDLREVWERAMQKREKTIPGSGTAGAKVLRQEHAWQETCGWGGMLTQGNAEDEL